MNTETYLPTEHEEQVTFVEWLQWKGLKFTSIPNSTFTKSWKQKRKNKVLGLNPGLPDLLVVLPKKCLLFIEMKRKKAGVVSEHQIGWITALNGIPNVRAIVARGADEAIQFTEAILEKF